MPDTDVIEISENNVSKDMFTKDQYTQFMGILSPITVLDYIANHKEEYENFVAMEADMGIKPND